MRRNRLMNGSSDYLLAGGEAMVLPCFGRDRLDEARRDGERGRKPQPYLRPLALAGR